MRRFALILALWPGFAAATEFWPLTGDEIQSTLAGQTLSYAEGVTQNFDASGVTHYFSGRPSTGRWAVREDRYCSTWPPSELWACYDVLQSGLIIRFIDDTGEITDGYLSE
jgi:hypothetical protein